MKKDVLITVKDIHTVEGSREAYEMITRGTWEGTPDAYTIEYNEQYDRLEGCRTVLNVKRGCVSMIRRGQYNTEMIIERGKRHSCEYSSPYGSMLIGVYAQKVNSTVDDGRGKLHLKYTIDFYGGVAGENELIFTLE